MDTSETYVKMCEKAEEIQSLMPKIIGSPEEENRKVWLPRQDQLQEMLGFNTVATVNNQWYGGGPLGLIQAFNHFISSLRTDEIAFRSMEQLWLAFVMKEKHNKMWDGELWK